MECKYCCQRVWEKKNTGINRYIMECKWGESVMTNDIIVGINRYIMECKCVKYRD